jgi:hypothetical protein
MPEAYHTGREDSSRRQIPPRLIAGGAIIALACNAEASAARFSDGLADPLHGDFDLLKGCRATATHDAFAARAEGAVGDASDSLFRASSWKTPGSSARARDLRKDVERAERLQAFPNPVAAWMLYVTHV